MVIFDEKSRKTTITLSCDKEDYLQTINALMNAISDASVNVGSETYLFYLCNLVKDMQPDWRQLVNIEEGEQLKRLNQKQR